MPAMYKSTDELESTLVTKGQLINELYPEDRFAVDPALPQQWVDNMLERGFGHNVTNFAFHFAMVYPRDGSQPFLAPLTQDGIRILGRLALAAA